VFAVASLVAEVFEGAAGTDAVMAIVHFLRTQHVTSLSDLQWLKLDWLCQAMQPHGLPPLLLNKFLSLARQRMEEAPTLPDTDLPDEPTEPAPLPVSDDA
jgi:hypothetical protein